MPNVLFVVSAAKFWTLKDGTRHATGFWAEELAVPHKLFSEAGWDVAIATPGGMPPTVDLRSLSLLGGTLPWKLGEINAYLASIDRELQQPLSLEYINTDEFDLVFYPGGHAPMEDLAVDPVSGELLARRLERGQPLALLCHAPAAILATEDLEGESPFRGRKITGLSNIEERLNPFGWKAKWLLEDRLKRLGTGYSKAPLPLMPHVVVDGNLYTGQNPQSSERLAKRLLQDLG